MTMNDSSHSRQVLSDLTIHMKYSKYIPDEHRRETWNELVTRNCTMHTKKFPSLTADIESAYQYVYRREVLPSMRSLQFGGKPIELSPARGYNCSYLPMSHVLAFSEVMFLLLSGTGVGYSVQRHHVEALPEVRKPTRTKRYLIGDSIEGWADAVKALMRSYLDGKHYPNFDFSDIRPKGARLKTSGGIAPGPEPLKDCLHNIQKVLDRHENGSKLSPLDVHDINCFIAEAVLSGGIRRSAMISLFSYTDEDMMACKTNGWWENNPQRAFANNSVVVVRHRIKKPDFDKLWKRIRLGHTGEPGVFFTNDKEIGTNPCAEVSLNAFQFCNLTTINLSDVADQKELEARAKAAAFIGTLQASYTDFHYLREIWRETTEEEALIGVSITGLATDRLKDFDLTKAAATVKRENKRVAKLLGINPAARTTVVKPEGTASLVVGASSGIHAWHSDYYLRRIRVMKNEPIYVYLQAVLPELVEDDFFKPSIQAVISIPVKAPEGAITRGEPAIALLDRVSHVYQTWIRPGHRSGVNHNNVSTTVSIKPDEWESIGKWMWEHRKEFTAISTLPYDGGDYVQAPFEEITEERFNELIQFVHDIDLSEVVELEDNTNLKDQAACAGNACEVT